MITNHQCNTSLSNNSIAIQLYKVDSKFIPSMGKQLTQASIHILWHIESQKYHIINFAHTYDQNML